MQVSNSSYKVGEKVLFGRTHGEQTLGEVVKVNPVKLRVKQLESRGTMRAYPVGTIWTVPPSLCSKVGSDSKPVQVEEPLKPWSPAPRRPEAEILKDICSTYSCLEPENLTCDGERRGRQVALRRAHYNQKLKDLFSELGRRVSDTEAFRAVYGY